MLYPQTFRMYFKTPSSYKVQSIVHWLIIPPAIRIDIAISLADALASDIISRVRVIAHLVSVTLASFPLPASHSPGSNERLHQK